MATFIVDTTVDGSDPNGGLSLREAIQQANATTEADTIRFTSALEDQTLTLTGGELVLSRDVTIDGDSNNDGQEVTLSGGDASRILQLSGDDTDVDLRGINLANGRVDGVANGGAILITAGGLTLTNCTIRDSSCGPDASGEGGGIFAGDGSRLSIERSAIFDNDAGYSSAGGGGIATGANATLVIRDSVLRENSAGYYGNGGAVLVTGDSSLTIEDTAVVGNRGYDTGGIEIQSSTASITRSTLADNRAFLYAGGLLLSDSNVSISDSTIVANRGYAGAIYALDGSMLAMQNSTVTGNISSGYYARTGGIWVTPESRLDLANSIVAGNAVDGPNAVGPDIAGAVTISNGHNILGSNVSGSVPGDLENVSPALLFAAIDPTTGGGKLADNGGPTQTVALRNGLSNPALAGADPTDTPATDQRGEPRPQPTGTDPDIGAFELNQIAVSLNEIVGTSRGEFLSGTAGADLIRGLGGDDRLWGRLGDDFLIGDAGKDVLAGKAGIDQMTGDAGADRFLFRRVGDAPAAGPSYDEILDFSRSQQDKMDLRPIDANRAVGGNQAFHFIGDEAFSRIGQLRYEATDDGDFLVSGNTDRDLEAELAFVVRTDLLSLKASDFML